MDDVSRISRVGNKGGRDGWRWRVRRLKAVQGAGLWEMTHAESDFHDTIAEVWSKKGSRVVARELVGSQLPPEIPAGEANWPASSWRSTGALRQTMVGLFKQMRDDRQSLTHHILQLRHRLHQTKTEIHHISQLVSSLYLCIFWKKAGELCKGVKPVSSFKSSGSDTAQWVDTRYLIGTYLVCTMYTLHTVRTW